MWIIFIILGVVLVWGLCKSGSRFSEPRAEDEETWEEPSGQPGKNSDDELEKIRRQVWGDHKRQEELRQKQLEKERMAPILEKQAALARQKELEDKYANSPLTREIIQTIRGGSNNLPEEIVVYDDRVTGRTNGVTRTYDFIANRVATLQRVYNCMLHYGDYELLLRPQVALGNAINRVLGGEYDVSDEAVRQSEQHAHSDGEIFFLFHYTSDHVLLRLKPKTDF